VFVYILRHAIAVQRGSPLFLTTTGRSRRTDRRRCGSGQGDCSSYRYARRRPDKPAHSRIGNGKNCRGGTGMEQKIEICKELLPGASAKKFLVYLAKYKSFENIMIVGHEPDLGYLASALVGSDQSIIELKRGLSAVLKSPRCLPGESAR